MKRTRLRNQFLKNRTDENESRCTKQRNYFVSILRKTKTHYYSNLEKNVADNEAAWKIVKLFLLDKIISKENMTLIEENEIASNNKDTTQVLSIFFQTS